MPYTEAYEVQCEHHQAVLESREQDRSEIGRILMVEHPAVITVTRRPEAASHVIASEETYWLLILYLKRKAFAFLKSTK